MMEFSAVSSQQSVQGFILMEETTSYGRGHVSVAMPCKAVSPSKPKFEYRNPKQIRSPNVPMTETTYANSAYGLGSCATQFGSFGFWSFDIVSSFGFRASNLANQSRDPLHTPRGCFLKAPSFGRGFFTSELKIIGKSRGILTAYHSRALGIEWYFLQISGG